MGKILTEIIGPRVPLEERARNAARYRAPAITFWLARFALLISIFLPFWQMDMEAPQYPKGLHITAYVNRVTGDVKEIDTLNHYIGMRRLEEAARFERSTAIAAIIALMLMVEGATLIHTRWAALLLAPAILFPIVFLVDLHLWLSYFGQNLNPEAPMSNTIQPFTPPVLGVGIIGQFKTIASVGIGWYLAAGGSALGVLGLFFHRRAYKPLVDAMRTQA